MTRLEADVVIVGGGMVGATLACALAHESGLKTALIERFGLKAGDKATYTADFDARSSALTLSTQRAFERIGLWSRLAANVAPISKIHVSDTGRFGSTVMNAEEENMDALGYVAENHWIGSVLAEGMHQSPKLSIHAPATALGVTFGSERVEIEFEQAGEHATVSARLLVVADGAGSPMSEKLGITVREQKYGQDALIANIGHRKPHQGIAYERFSDHGPMAMLPLVDDGDGSPRSALVWVREHHETERLLGLPEAEFSRELQRAFGYRVGRIERIGSRQSYSLRLVRSSEQVRQRLVVLGNAAHALHPVAGQGFNLSVRDADALAQVVLAAHATGQDIGDLTALEGFFNRRLIDQERTIVASDLLPRIFANGWLPVTLGRDAALVGLQLLPTLRSGFVRYATGLGAQQ